MVNYNKPAISIKKQSSTLTTLFLITKNKHERWSNWSNKLTVIWPYASLNWINGINQE